MSYWTSNAAEDVAKQHEVASTVLHVAAGVYTWELASTLPFDWSLVRRHRGCIWGALVYFACRYTTFLSLVSGMVFLDSPVSGRIKTLDGLFQVTNAISHGFACSLVVSRVASLWKNPTVSIITVVLQLGLWVIILRSLIQHESIWDDALSHDITGAYLAMFTVLSSILVYLALLRAVRRKPDPDPSNNPTALKKMQKTMVLLYFQGFPYFVVPSITIMGATFLAVADISATLNWTLGLVAFVVLSTCACRIYRGMVLGRDACPAKLLVKMSYKDEDPSHSAALPMSNLPPPGSLSVSPNVSASGFDTSDSYEDRPSGSHSGTSGEEEEDVGMHVFGAECNEPNERRRNTIARSPSHSSPSQWMVTEIAV